MRPARRIPVALILIPVLALLAAALSILVAYWFRMSAAGWTTLAIFLPAAALLTHLAGRAR